MKKYDCIYFTNAEQRIGVHVRLPLLKAIKMHILGRGVILKKESIKMLDK